MEGVQVIFLTQQWVPTLFLLFHENFNPLPLVVPPSRGDWQSPPQIFLCISQGKIDLRHSRFNPYSDIQQPLIFPTISSAAVSNFCKRSYLGCLSTCPMYRVKCYHSIINQAKLDRSVIINDSMKFVAKHQKHFYRR